VRGIQLSVFDQSERHLDLRVFEKSASSLKRETGVKLASNRSMRSDLALGVNSNPIDR
jgi:hypothetical protein